MNGTPHNRALHLLVCLLALLATASVYGFYKSGEASSNGSNIVYVSGEDASGKPTSSEYYATGGEAFEMRFDDALLVCESGSLRHGTKLSVSGIDRSLPPLGAGMVNVTSGHAGYRFLPHGEHFRKAAGIQIGYDEAKLPKGFSHKDIYTYYYDEGMKVWKRLQRDSVSDGTVYSRTTHFTDMINAVVSHPEMPEGQAFTPTGLKELKAASPSAGVTMAEVSAGNSQGELTARYPIELPQGRGGMQPNLAIGYSSGGGDGLLGVGWDMHTSAISVDSRWGAPRYDSQYETESYVIDGNSQLSHTAYSYDPAGNITQAVSSYPWLPNQTFTENFAYDSTNQLVSAANPQTYALSVTYGDCGKIQQYGLSQTDLASNTTTSQTRYYSYGSLNEGQTAFAPNSINYADGTNVNEQYGIGGSLQRRETTAPGNQPNEELYRFGADGNLRLYSYDRLFYSLYGYDCGTTRTYKYSMDLSPNWVNGRLESVNFNLHNAMFYPNSYLNFNNDGYYTKHYYNGMERIASRLGDNNLSLATHNPELQDRKWQLDSNIRSNIVDITGYDFLPVGEEQDPDDPKPVFELPQVGITGLQPIGSGDIFYYHPNHLGSTCYVTDENASVQQGFLYAPFGEITNEHNSGWQNGTLPKYSFNVKELDEETGMYYYEARYMAPPTFISRDPHFELYSTFSPYTYCYNNPVKYIDPTGKDGLVVVDEENKTITIKVNIILHTKRLGTAILSQAAKDYKKAIMDKWGKDENGNPWTIQHNEESYTVNFDVNVSVDQNSYKAKNRNYNGMNNYIEVVSAGYRSKVHNCNSGIWALPTSAHNSAPHEFGHLLGLKDRYSEYKTKSGYRSSMPHQGWEANIMAEYGGITEQKTLKGFLITCKKIKKTRMELNGSLAIYLF